MRKLNVILIFSVFFLLLNISESNGQCSYCPPGSTASSCQVAIGNCTVTVNFCLDCSPTGHAIASLCNISLPYTCMGLPIDHNFWIQARREMLKAVGAQCASVYGEIPPCSTSVRPYIEIVTPACVKIYQDPNNMNYSIIGTCDAEAGQCSIEYEVC